MRQRQPLDVTGTMCGNGLRVARATSAKVPRQRTQQANMAAAERAHGADGGHGRRLRRPRHKFECI
jgi:hypothetical protein